MKASIMKIQSTHSEPSSTFQRSYVLRIVLNILVVFSSHATEENDVSVKLKNADLYTAAAAATAKSLQSCQTLCDPRDDSPQGSPSPWDSPGKNTGVGCHFLLQCMKVISEVTQLWPTLHDPMDCSLPGSSAHGIFQARVLEWGAIAFSEIYIHTHIKRKKKKQ